jgi:hypothetical protein
MKRNVSVVSLIVATRSSGPPASQPVFRCNILIRGKIIKEIPGSVASGTLCIFPKVSHIRTCTTVWVTFQFYLQEYGYIYTFYLCLNCHLFWAGNRRFLIMNRCFHITVCRITFNATCSTEVLKAFMQMVQFFLEIRRLTHC